MDSACTNRKLSNILCQLKGQGLTGEDVRYTEFVENISGDSNFILSAGSHSYTITVLQGSVVVHGSTLTEGSWTFSAPLGGDFGQVLVDASGSTSTFIQAIYSWS